MTRRTNYILAAKNISIGTTRAAYLRVHVLNRCKSIVFTARNTPSIIAMLLWRRPLRTPSGYVLPRERLRSCGATTHPCRQGTPTQIPPHLRSTGAVGLEVTIW
ncbi:hypothetical protein E4U24_001678 [Claviceps purpurea]|nr:hypothetical protein E4U24_001678 [Claviceps purpurea]